ncbi:MAG: helix-turn-helix domain-containing protein [Eubacterium sp.]
MTLGNRLYEMRKAKGLSQENVADILGVTRQTVSKWETDQTTPDFDKILPICQLYNITTEQLLTGEKAENPYYEPENNTNENLEDKEKAEKGRLRSAMLMAVAVCLYIMSVIPFFVIKDSKIMMTVFFTVIGVATLLVVFSSLTKPKASKTVAQTKENRLFKQITGILSSIVLVIYLLVSFITGAWYITWIIWVIYGIICEIIKLVFTLKGAQIDEED